MKKAILPLIILLFLINTKGKSQTKIPLDSVNKYIGKEVEITDTIAQVKIASKAFYLHFAGKYPNNKFSAVIYDIDFANFPDRLKWKEGKVATITGTVRLYHDKPRIILADTNQITIK
jgi:hypothetical protein